MPLKNQCTVKKMHSLYTTFLNTIVFFNITIKLKIARWCFIFQTRTSTILVSIQLTWKNFLKIFGVQNIQNVNRDTNFWGLDGACYSPQKICLNHPLALPSVTNNNILLSVRNFNITMLPLIVQFLS